MNSKIFLLLCLTMMQVRNVYAPRTVDMVLKTKKEDEKWEAVEQYLR